MTLQPVRDGKRALRAVRAPERQRAPGLDPGDGVDQCLTSSGVPKTRVDCSAVLTLNNTSWTKHRAQQQTHEIANTLQPAQSLLLSPRFGKMTGPSGAPRSVSPPITEATFKGARCGEERALHRVIRAARKYEEAKKKTGQSADTQHWKASTDVDRQFVEWLRTVILLHVQQPVDTSVLGTATSPTSERFNVAFVLKGRGRGPQDETDFTKKRYLDAAFGLMEHSSEYIEQHPRDVTHKNKHPDRKLNWYTVRQWDSPRTGLVKKDGVWYSELWDQWLMEVAQVRAPSARGMQASATSADKQLHPLLAMAAQAHRILVIDETLMAADRNTLGAWTFATPALRMWMLTNLLSVPLARPAYIFSRTTADIVWKWAPDDADDYYTVTKAKDFVDALLGRKTASKAAREVLGHMDEEAARLLYPFLHNTEFGFEDWVGQLGF